MAAAEQIASAQGAAQAGREYGWRQASGSEMPPFVLTTDCVEGPIGLAPAGFGTITAAGNELAW